jgi:nitroreductase
LKVSKRRPVRWALIELDDAIKGRRSIRSCKDEPVSIELVLEVLEAGTWAPSAKNGQQWRFTVLTGDAKTRLAGLFRSELQALSAKIGMERMGSSFGSCKAMGEAPVLVMVWNANKLRTLEESSLQSVAAAIQNMFLKAYNLGLGSLWICDVYYASDALTKHLGKPWTLVVAVALGWPAQSPEPRLRKSVEEVSEFLEQCAGGLNNCDLYWESPISTT